ncbi:serine/threonine protein kinase [Luminiphilus sp.]|nr:serine/threonine protein kinase [Luminiphilus sp.]
MSQPYAGLTPDTVIDCIEQIGYRCDLRLLVLNSYENRVYQVGIEDETPVIAKFYREGRWTDTQILEEHEFALELQSHGLSVVAPLVVNGATLHHAMGHRFSVFPRRGGHPPELDNLDHLLSLGRTLARIHRVGATLTLPQRSTLSIDRTVTQSREFVLEHFVPRDLVPAYSSLAQDCEQAIRGLLSTHDDSMNQIIHGDCHTGNILWRDDTPHFVDLDDCYSAPIIQDLWMFLSGDRQQRELQLGELIAGYEEFNDFDPAQLRWIEALRTMRIMHYAAWLGRRWDDPAFPKAFPWFGQERFWGDHVLELREQLAAMQEPPLRLL